MGHVDYGDANILMDVKVARIAIDEYSPHTLCDELKDDASSLYVRSERMQALRTDSLKKVIDLAVRPGIFIEQKLEEREVHRLLFGLSKIPELIPIVRFITLYAAKVKSERCKPLFRMWEE